MTEPEVAFRLAKKYLLQNQVKSKKLMQKYQKFEEVLLTFFDLSTSCALQAKNEEALFVRDGFSGRSVFREPSISIPLIQKFLETLGSKFVFVRFADWKYAGIALARCNDIASVMEELLFASDDFIQLTDVEFLNSLLIDGSRAGTGDQLNELDVKVLGISWPELLQL